jgi:hypothetical protein
MPRVSNHTTIKPTSDDFSDEDEDTTAPVPIPHANGSRNRAITECGPVSHSFPIVKGSMLSTPPLKSFENHLASKRSHT